MRLVSLFVFVLLLLTSVEVLAKGKGPIGLWAIDENYVLVADSSLPGIVLVDIAKGVALERLKMHGNPTCITSCPDCDFAFITGKNGNSWKLIFDQPIQELMKEAGYLNLSSRKLKRIKLSYKDGSNNGKIDARQCLLDADGKTAYIAALYDGEVFALRFGKSGALESLSVESKEISLYNRLMKKIGLKEVAKEGPYGLHWGEDGNLLVANHKRDVLRMSRDGEVVSVYRLKDYDCKGMNGKTVYLRAAIDDPNDHRAMLLLTSHPRFYDAALWRLVRNINGEPESCSLVAGTIGGTSGWVDAEGENTDAQFTRAHYFVLRPQSDGRELIISDIDNRSLRVLDIQTGETSTVMYDRDVRLRVSGSNKKSRQSCSEVTPASMNVVETPAGGEACVHFDKSSLSIVRSQSDAEAYCGSIGGRLCEPSELRQVGFNLSFSAFTAAECGSCWQPEFEDTCDPQIIDFKPQGTHKTVGFKHSWLSGYAIEEVGPKPSENKTVCHDINKPLEAAAVCCSDVY